MSGDGSRAVSFGVRFVSMLVRREYVEAYSMIARELKVGVSIDEMIVSFESYIPDGYVVDPLEVVRTMDRGKGVWMYIAVGGDNAEGVSLVVKCDDADCEIIEAEFGRP